MFLEYDTVVLAAGPMLQLLEQLSFLQIENGKNYKWRVRSIDEVALEAYSRRSTNAIGVSDAEFVQGYVKLLNELDYSCSVCGKLYDCGLPSKEIVHAHISTYCMVDKFRREHN